MALNTTKSNQIVQCALVKYSVLREYTLIYTVVDILYVILVVFNFRFKNCSCMTISEEDTYLLAVAHSKDKQNHRTFVVPVINIQIMSWLFLYEIR